MRNLPKQLSLFLLALLCAGTTSAEVYDTIPESSATSLPRTAAVASTAGLSVDNAIDGSDSFWSSNVYGDAVHTEWMYIDLGGMYDVDRIKLTPRANAYGFPIDFVLQYSNDASTWIDLPGQDFTNYVSPLGVIFGDSDQWFDFDGVVNTRYIRLYATKLGMDDGGNFYCQIVEFNAEPPRPALDTPFFTSMGNQWDSRLNTMWRIFGAVNDGTDAVNLLGNEAAYWEWVPLKILWTNETAYKADLKSKILDAPMTSDGYVWSWGDMEPWPSSCRHQENNAKFILGVYHIVMWEGMDFLDEVDPATALGGEDISEGMTVKAKLDLAMEHMRIDMSGNTGILIVDNGENDGTVGSKSSDYYDNYLMGYKMAYATIYYYASLKALAEIETVLGNSAQATVYETLRTTVYDEFNTVFWDATKLRYIGCIDINANVWDFGFTYLNTEAISYGLADQTKAEHIYDWLDGNRIIASDSSQGADIYQWVIAPQTNTDAIEKIGPPYWWWDWNGGIEVDRNAKFNTHQTNGGTILYQAYYDVLARSMYLGADNAFTRFSAILDEFSYDELRRDPTSTEFGDRHVVGCIDEFPESGLVPYVYLAAFVGVDATASGLDVFPNLPSAMDSAGVDPVEYLGNEYRIVAWDDTVKIQTNSGSVENLTGRIGNLTASQTYTVKNEDLTNGTISYSYVNTDSDGTLSYDEDVNGERRLTIYYDPLNSVPVSVEKENVVIAVFPNPFNSTTYIQYEISQQSDVAIEICDLSGASIMSLSNSNQEAGVYTESWNGTNTNGDKVSNGIYFVKLTVHNLKGISILRNKLTLIK